MANPSLNDPDLKKLLKVMKAAGYPMHINVRTEPGALLFECVDNVNKMVHIVGGDIVLGWQIWKTKHLIEAELHAVWQRPDRTLVDVSPKQFPASQIVFLKDSQLQNNGLQVENFRINISRNKLADDLITVSKARFDFLNRGERANLKLLKLTVQQDNHLTFMNDLLSKINSVLDAGGNEETSCPCNSGKRIKECHLHNLPAKLASVL